VVVVEERQIGNGVSLAVRSRLDFGSPGHEVLVNSVTLAGGAMGEGQEQSMSSDLNSELVMILEARGEVGAMGPVIMNTIQLRATNRG
jgi:hypothetical protein